MRASASALGRVVRWVWVATGVLILVTVGSTTFLVTQGRSNALREGDDRLRGLVAAAETDINRSLVSVDLTLAGLPRLLSAAALTGGFDVEKAQVLLAELQDRQIAFGNITLVDESGQTITSALRATRRSDLELPVGFYDGVFASPLPTLAVFGPLRGRASGERSLLFARRIAVDGSPPIAAIAEVPSSQLLPVAASSFSGPGLRLSLERGDGSVLATQPPDDRWGGPPRSRDPASLDLSGAPHDLPRGDGSPQARQAVRPTLYPPLVIGASWEVESMLAGWANWRGHVIVASIAIGVVLICSAALAHWQLLRLVQARLSAADAAELLDQAMNSMGDAFLVCDAEDRVVRWNNRYLDYFPWQRDVIGPGVPFRVLGEQAARHALPDVEPEKRAQWLEERLASRGLRDEFVQVVHTGAFVSTVERRMPDGGVVSVYRDMSRRERELALAKQEADAANEAKSRFLANMSHEIRTPLNAVLGLNGLILEDTLSAEQRERALLVQSSGQLLLTLINDILDLSRIDAGRIDLQSVPFSPGPLAAEVVALLHERARAVGLAIELVVAPNVPGQVHADAMRVRQVLLNLVGNALKFTERGGVTVRVDFLPERGLLELEVEDTGIGIAAAELERLFDRFTQADVSTTRRYGGSGLGLAITKEIVSRMGGNISVRSVLGRGSCFTARVRCEVMAELPDAAVTQPPLPKQQKGLRLLVAEDHPINQLLMRAMLERRGHEVVIAEDGQAAVSEVRLGYFDLVLMDMQMPSVDGLTATRQIRALDGPKAHVPIVAMTANARAEDRDACLQAGMNAFLTKPVDAEALDAMIAGTLRERAMDASGDHSQAS
ncbi:MAG: response regulator [Proteobacteria bacterium]|nr:response regulator [Pseudomonadota bacterium]